MRLIDYEGAYIHPSALVSPEAHYYGTGRVVIERNARVDHGVLILGDVEIDHHAHIAPYACLYGKAGLRIGAYTGICVGVVLHTDSDDYSGRSMMCPTVPTEYKPFQKIAPIVIGKLCLIGVHSVALPGVTVGDNVSVGTHSLIKDDLEPDTMYAGAPTKMIRRKSKDVWRLTREFEMGLGAS